MGQQFAAPAVPPVSFDVTLQVIFPQASKLGSKQRPVDAQHCFVPLQTSTPQF